ncbi:MAG TPA: hypothetical protein V6C65_17405 [Allocoleopsis sp.]
MAHLVFTEVSDDMLIYNGEKIEENWLKEEFGLVICLNLALVSRK